MAGPEVRDVRALGGIVEGPLSGRTGLVVDRALTGV